MTRAEAIKILSRIWGGNPQHDLANSYADAFVALGILKFDEPKSLPQKLRNFIMDARLAQGDAMQRLWNLHDVLKDCGLKITDVESPQETEQ